ncbi:MAG: ATP-binding protein [Rhodothermaceae bacterium]
MSKSNPTYDELLSENKRLKDLLLANNQCERESRPENSGIERYAVDANELNRLAINASKAGTLILDIPKDKLIWDNRSCEIFGIDEKSFGQSYEAWVKYVHPDDVEKIQTVITRQLKYGSLIDIRYRIIRADGEIRHIWANASIIRNEQGEPVILSGLHFDETERVIAKQQLENKNIELEKINTSKDKFIRILAHDLKSPFSSILGFLNNLIENVRYYDIEEIENQLNLVFSSANSAYKLLEEILIWEIAQTGNISFNPKELSLKKVCMETIKNLELTAAKKEITIEISSLDDVTVLADKNMLSTILRNLINNSIKFTAKGGIIKIDCETTHEKLIISITDSGVGISQEILEKLFNISKTKSTRGTMNEKGTGLGLLLCKEFIEKHSGEINIESEINVGTKVSFSLPHNK